jgi:signal transduction histidine kinase
MGPGVRVAAAAVLAAAAVAQVLLRAGREAEPTLLVLLCLLALATTLPLAAARPVPAAVTVTAAALLSIGPFGPFGLFGPFGALTAAGVVATVAALYRAGRAGRPVAVALTVPFVVAALVDAARSGAGVSSVVLAVGAPAAVWTGLMLWARTRFTIEAKARQDIAGSLLEHTARGERARIARELHDVVAHHISMVVVQAESARVTTPGLPPVAAQRLVEVGDTARAGLTEMRRLLGVLREDADVDVPERQPQPGLAQLHELVDDARAVSGAVTRLIVSGSPVTLDPGVELAAYRIVQEALTNARRHAPGAAVDVELRYVDDELAVRVRDNGPGPPPPAGVDGQGHGHGHGLQGMRERATAVGGRLRSGPATVGGFMLEATLPVKSEVPP